MAIKKSTIRAYIHTPSWNLSPANTDLRLRKTLQSMHERFPQILFYIPQGFWISIGYNVKYVINAIIGRICRKLHLPYHYLFDMTYYSLNLHEVRKFNPEVIISQGAIPDNNHDIPLIWEMFFIDPYNFNGIKNSSDWDQYVIKYRDLAKKASILGVRDYYSIDLIRKLMPEHASKTRLLPYYLPDLEPLNESEIRDKHFKPTIIKLLFVGGQAKRKGLPQLIEAIKIIDQIKTINIQLVVVSALSDGNINIPSDLPIIYKSALPHEEVLTLFKESHIYVMPSEFESFGISYIEGMANGCAVIARDFQPQRDMMDYGKSGLLVSSSDIHAIATSIMNLCNDEEMRLNISLNGSRKFKSTYHWTIVAQNWINVIEEISQ